MLSIRSDVESVGLSVASIIYSEVFQEMYGQLAISTILIYDTIITTDKEVQYFWSTPRKFVSLIYFLNRYVGVFSALSSPFYDTFRASNTLCLYSFWSTEPASWMTILLLDYILYMRVMALFSQDEKLAIWLKSLFGLEAAFTLGILLYESLAEGIAVETLAKGVTICEVEKVLPVMWPTLYWAGPLAYEFILMVLALYKAADFWRSSAGLRGFGLVKVIVQDQAIYFLLVISCGCCKIISFHLATFNLLHDNLFDTIGGATLLCVLGSRLLVNLKEAGERGVNGGTSYRASTMSNMEFS